MKKQLKKCPVCFSESLVIKKIKNSNVTYEYCPCCNESFYGPKAMEYFKQNNLTPNKKILTA